MTVSGFLKFILFHIIFILIMCQIYRCIYAWASEVFIFTDSVIKIDLCSVQIIIGSQCFGTWKLPEVVTSSGRSVISSIIIKGVEATYDILYLLYTSKIRFRDFFQFLNTIKNYFVLLVLLTFVLTALSESVINEDFLPLACSYVFTNTIMNWNTPPLIAYGEGMACSFNEGFLMNVIPPDGVYLGLEESMQRYQAVQGVLIPVKKVFILITKSLYCPPDLKGFNKQHRPDLPWMEAITSLDPIIKDVSGVKNRVYTLSMYMINRPNRLRGVPIAIGTSLYTLFKVLEKRTNFGIGDDVDQQQIIEEYCAQLEKVIARCPELRGKCVIVRFDDTNENLNLADVLLDKVREIQPNLDEIMANAFGDLINYCTSNH